MAKRVSINRIVSTILGQAYLKLLFVLLLTLSIAWTYHLFAIHRTLCSVVMSKLENEEGPLSREFFMGNIEASNEIFTSFEKTLRPLTQSVSLRLVQAKDLRDPSDVQACQPKLLGSSLYFPLMFGSKIVGAVQGYVSAFSWTELLVILFAFSVGTLFITLAVARRMARALSEYIMEPITHLSRAGSPITHGDAIPAEVEEISENIQRLQDSIRKIEREKHESDKSRSLAELAAQLAHDIQSPIAALNAAAPEFSALPPDTRELVSAATTRIQDIANRLLRKHRAPSVYAAEPVLQAQSIGWLSDLIVREKCLLARGNEDVRIELEPYDLTMSFACVEGAVFSRVMSNLLNNAIEAIKGTGSIVVRVAVNDDNWVVVTVIDSGTGIPEEILTKIGTRGFTYGKPDGNGLGLHHAKSSVESWGGRIEVKSNIRVGTCVALWLPRAPASSEAPLPLDRVSSNSSVR